MLIINKLRYTLYNILSRMMSEGVEKDRLNSLGNAASFDKTVKITPTATIDNLAYVKEKIEIGKGSVICGQLLIFAHAGAIQIGRDCYLGVGSRIWSSESIVIGDRVLISHNVNIHDTNSHSLDFNTRHRHFKEIFTSGHPKTPDYDIQSRPVVIHDDVWVCFNVTILKGVTIGRGAIIASSSVVTKNVPEYTMVAGNPAKIIKKL